MWMSLHHIWQSYLVMSWRTIMSMFVRVQMSDCTLHFPATCVGLIVLRIGLDEHIIWRKLLQLFLWMVMIIVTHGADMLYTSMVGSHWPLSQCQLPMYVWCTAITYLTLYTELQNRVRTVLLTLPALLCECILCRLSVIVCFASDKPVVVLVYPDCYFSVIPCHAWCWRSSEFVSILVLRLSHNRNDSDIGSGATVIACDLSGMM